SWKISPMRPPRTARSSRLLLCSAVSSCSCGAPGSSTTLPDTTRPGRSRMPRMARAVTLLPQPRSPTTPSTRPAYRSMLTLSIARTTPWVSGNSTARSRTASTWRLLDGVSALAIPDSAVATSAIGVRRVAQSVAEEVERQDDQDDRHGGGQQPWRTGQHLHVLRVLQQDAPTDRRRTQAEAEEAQRRFADNHCRQRKADRGDDVAGERRQHVAQDDAKLAGAGEVGPPDQRDDDGDGEINLRDAPGVGQCRGEAHPKRDRRDRAHDLDDALDDRVDHAAIKAGESPQQHAERQAEADSGKSDRQRDAGRHRQARIEVAAQLVGAEQENTVDGLSAGDAE